jgi:DNA invertase Pin-like site-specific DNA recombinase
MERELIMERTRAGLQSARRQGRVGGRKRQMTDSKIEAAKKLLASGTTPHEVAHSLGVSVPRCIVGYRPLHGRKGAAIAGGQDLRAGDLRFRYSLLSSAVNLLIV